MPHVKFSKIESLNNHALSFSEYQNQEAMVGQAMEECVPEQLSDLDVKRGELVHILSKNPDGRWRVFVIRRQVCIFTLHSICVGLVRILAYHI